MRVVLALSLAACGAAVPPLPSQGGPAWLELTSEHFTLWTDGSRERGRELIVEMENLRQVVIGIGFRGVPGAGRSFVIALRDDDEAGAFMPGEFAAIASAGGYIRQPMILLAAESSRDPRHVISAHELTHTVSHVVIRNQPRWFAEGLAKYFETIEIDRGAGTVELGRAPTHNGQPMRITRLMPLSQLFECTDLTCVDEHFYASAWALFTYLTNARGDELARYEQQLIDLSGDSKHAWHEVFGATPLEQLEQEMRHWIVEGSHRVFKYNVKLRTWPITERTLKDADVYAARALLRLQFQERRDTAKIAVDAALAIDPNHVLAHAIGYELDGTIEPKVARALARAHPDDWRAWWLVTVAVKQGDESRRAMYAACELIAKNPAIAPPWQPCPRVPAITE